MPQLSLKRWTLVLAAAIILVIVIVVAFSLSSSNTPTPTTTTTGPSVLSKSGDCHASLVSFSTPGAPALTKAGTYVSITITNKAGSLCKFPLVQLPATKTSGYGFIFAQGRSNGSPVGPIGVLRGTLGSKEITLPVGTPPSSPTADFTFGLSTTKSIPDCQPRTVSSIAFSLDGTHWQTIDFKDSPYFTQGLSVCTGPTSNLNTSPVDPLLPNKTHTHKK